MNTFPRRLPNLFKTPGDHTLVHDYLLRKLAEDPDWLPGRQAQAREALLHAGQDAQALRAWCAEWLSSDQVELLRQILRIVAHHQRVYKRTVMLSPRAHLLIKTLADLESLKMSEVIEIHLARTLRESHGLEVRISVDERTGQVDYGIAPTTA